MVYIGVITHLLTIYYLPGTSKWLRVVGAWIWLLVGKSSIYTFPNGNVENGDESHDRIRIKITKKKQMQVGKSFFDVYESLDVWTC